MLGAEELLWHSKKADAARRTETLPIACYPYNENTEMTPNGKRLHGQIIPSTHKGEVMTIHCPGDQLHANRIRSMQKKMGTGSALNRLQQADRQSVTTPKERLSGMLANSAGFHKEMMDAQVMSSTVCLSFYDLL